MRRLSYAFAACLIASTAHADLRVTFQDGAPKDSFTITNIGACATGQFGITFDLFPSPAGLIFDVTAQGAGVDVFQPFEVTLGSQLIEGVSAVADGDQILTLLVSSMAPGDIVSFTIDVDDTTGQRPITVSGGEIAGASVFVMSYTLDSDALFDDTGTAILTTPECN